MSILDGVDSMEDYGPSYLSTKHLISEATVDEKRYVIWNLFFHKHPAIDLKSLWDDTKADIYRICGRINQLKRLGEGKSYSLPTHEWVPDIETENGKGYLKCFQTFSHREGDELENNAFLKFLREAANSFDRDYLMSLSKEEWNDVARYGKTRANAMKNNHTMPAVVSEALYTLYHQHFPELEQWFGLAEPKSMHSWLLGQKYHPNATTLDDGSLILDYTSLYLKDASTFSKLYLAKDPYGNNMVWGYDQEKGNSFKRAPTLTLCTWDDLVRGKQNDEANRVLKDIRFDKEVFDAINQTVIQTFDKHWSNGFNNLFKDMQYQNPPLPDVVKSVENRMKP